MDAVEFVKERNRMCDFYESKCTGCPLEGKQCTVFRGLDIEHTISEVEEWSAAHPHKTRQTELLKQYPETALDENGVISICPKRLSLAYRNNSGGCKNPGSRCDDCRREFWMQRVE